MKDGTVRFGVISDTHGLLRPEAVAALKEVRCEGIIHAGDVGDPAVLHGLRAIAPVTAVRGNVDWGAWAESLPVTATFHAGAACIHVLHDRNALPANLGEAGWDVVISGHSHKPMVEQIAGVLFLNPGAAGPRRFRLPVTLAILETAADGKASAKLNDLAI